MSFGWRPPAASASAAPAASSSASAATAGGGSGGGPGVPVRQLPQQTPTGSTTSSSKHVGGRPSSHSSSSSCSTRAANHATATGGVAAGPSTSSTRPSPSSSGTVATSTTRAVAVGSATTRSSQAPGSSGQAVRRPVTSSTATAGGASVQQNRRGVHHTSHSPPPSSVPSRGGTVAIASSSNNPGSTPGGARSVAAGAPTSSTPSSSGPTRKKFSPASVPPSSGPHGANLSVTPAQKLPPSANAASSSRTEKGNASITTQTSSAGKLPPAVGPPSKYSAANVGMTGTCFLGSGQSAQDQRRYLFICGGSREPTNEILSTFGCYDVEKETWLKLSPGSRLRELPVPMYGHSCVSHGGFVWLIGGMSVNDLGHVFFKSVLRLKVSLETAPSSPISGSGTAGDSRSGKNNSAVMKEEGSTLPQLVAATGGNDDPSFTHYSVDVDSKFTLQYAVMFATVLKLTVYGSPMALIVGGITMCDDTESGKRLPCLTNRVLCIELDSNSIRKVNQGGSVPEPQCSGGIASFPSSIPGSEAIVLFGGRTSLHSTAPKKHPQQQRQQGLVDEKNGDNGSFRNSQGCEQQVVNGTPVAAATTLSSSRTGGVVSSWRSRSRADASPAVYVGEIFVEESLRSVSIHWNCFKRKSLADTWPPHCYGHQMVFFDNCFLLVGSCLDVNEEEEEDQQKRPHGSDASSPIGSGGGDSMSLSKAPSPSSEVVVGSITTTTMSSLQREKKRHQKRKCLQFALSIDLQVGCAWSELNLTECPSSSHPAGGGGEASASPVPCRARRFHSMHASGNEVVLIGGAPPTASSSGCGCDGGRSKDPPSSSSLATSSRGSGGQSGLTSSASSSATTTTTTTNTTTNSTSRASPSSITQQRQRNAAWRTGLHSRRMKRAQTRWRGQG